MHKKHTLFPWGILLASLLVTVPLTGCGSQTSATDLMKDVSTDHTVTAQTLSPQETLPLTDFSVRLFQQQLEDNENTLLSPVSILYALGMTSNGAAGDTKAQMESVMGLSVSDLNDTLYAYHSYLPSEDKYKLEIANSIWLNQDLDLQIKKDFLQTNADYYGASIYEAPFDTSTAKNINQWCSDHTDQMIPKILESAPSKDSAMYLINAICFDAEWEEIYQASQVQEGVFTTQDGTEQDAQMMYSTEYRYLKDEHATGFLKYYADEKYAFAALLPEEGMALSDYVATLDGEKLHSILSNAENDMVDVVIPKFETSYGTDLVRPLKELGMTDALDSSSADFSDMTDNRDLFISSVMHKTYIAVDEKGTKAGAVTSVEMKTTAANPEDMKTVYLNRPFLYMLIDCETNTPLFIGAEMSIE